MVRHPPDASLAAIAKHQHGVVTMAQLRATGLAKSSISKRVANGRLHRVHRGVYTVGHASLSTEARWMAAVLATGDGAVLSHLAAAALWEIWRRRTPPRIDVVSPARRRGRHRGVQIHECLRLDRRDVTLRHGIPLTTVARTLVDLTDVLDPGALANVIHEAAFRGRFDGAATRTAMVRAGGRHHLDVLVAALDAHAGGSAGTRSAPEDAFLALVRSRGLPEPLVNVPVKADRRRIEVDFQWPQLGLCVEVDGPGHRRPRTRLDDVQRDELLRALGREVLRFTDEDVELRPAEVLAALEARLPQADA